MRYELAVHQYEKFQSCGNYSEKASQYLTGGNSEQMMPSSQT